MAEEKNTGGDSGSRNRRRKGRRRYFRRRSGGDEQKQPDGNKKEQPGTGKSRPNERARNDRRRRRRRSRSGRERASSGPSIIDEISSSYTPPDSVFIYTHIIRRDQRDTAYEYRPEHFSSSGRNMADFRIDLTPLYDDILDPSAAPEEVQEELRRIAAARPPVEPVDIFRDFESDYDGSDEEEEENENDSSNDSPPMRRR